MPSFGKQKFVLKTQLKPTGDQPQAIQALVQGLKDEKKSQVLLGVTGSGKTFTMANVIAEMNLPTLVLSHNKTLAAQLFSEFKEFFPDNAVEYFVSYYDYYQPEAYIPQTDTYIEKDAQINDEIDKLRHSATRSLLERNDVLIVSSISCIYGLGSPEAYEGLLLYLEVGQEIKRQDVLRKLVEIQYQRNNVDFHRGIFRVRGDVVEVYPAYEEDLALRIEFFGDMIENISEIDPLRGLRLQTIPRVAIYPASHYVTTADNRKRAIESVRVELRERLQELRSLEKNLEAERLTQRTLYDLEMLEQLGYCQGIENYSRHLTGRKEGVAPPTLLEYFPKPWLLFIDESHVSVPQIGGMYRGDRARKMTLVEHGFRLPSALDNRPLNFDEWEASLSQTIYVSATPGAYELDLVGGKTVEQVIRPTGLVDPRVEVRSATTQVEDLLKEIKLRTTKNERVLVTTLTKKLAEELTKYYHAQGIKVKYLHSDIVTLERIEILRDLRLGAFDVLIGINLLREGLDLPEVSLVAVLDADKEGFLRSERSLIQTIGRAARNVEGFVILYAEKITESMKKAIFETERRRFLQEKYNKKHGIIPTTIVKKVRDSISASYVSESKKSASIVMQLDLIDEGAQLDRVKELTGEYFTTIEKLPETIGVMEKDMKEKAKLLQFEDAALLRDRVKKLRGLALRLVE
ncbi:MAG: excinuclease ABC subunit UvrB [Bdellovibrio sp.]|nr:excinuclease ABC subunit UvrB [Bdellovibrio sp.]